MHSEPRRDRAGRAAWRTLALATPFALTACGGVLDPEGPIGAAEKSILIDSMAIMLAIVVPTILAIGAFAWWFRASNPRARRRPEFAFSGRIELVVWSVPLLTIMLLGGVTWIGSHALDPARPIDPGVAPLEIQVVSLDWKWLFIYPALGVATVNELDIPAGVPVHLALTSASVLNSFFVPQFGSQIYTMNGMASQLYLRADHPGTFHGLSTHFSGDGFSDMRFDARAMTEAEFGQWTAAAKREGQPLDSQRYAKLAEQGIQREPLTFRLIDEHLFDHIISQALPPGPGPVVEEPGKTPTTPVGQHAG